MFEVAGLPRLPVRFATDKEYTMFALLAPGSRHGRGRAAPRWPSEHHRHYDSGKVVHETVTDGSV